MASTVKRYFAGFLAFWFAVFSVVFPVAANAAVYNATPTFTGRAWYVPAAGPLTSLGPVASIAVGLGRLNPWITAGMVGLSIYRFVVETQSLGTIGIVSDGQLFTPIPGWSNSNSPPATAASSGVTVETTATVSGWKIVGAQTYTGTDLETICRQAISGQTVTPQLRYHSIQTTFPYKCNTSYYPSTSLYGSYGTVSLTSVCPDSSWTLSGGVCSRSNAGCPSGYALVSGVCQLTDDPKVMWPSDGQPTYVPRVGDNGVYQWWPADRDPDQGTYPQANINQFLQSGDIFTDPYGNPVTQTVTPTTDGGYTIQQQIQHSPAGSGNTYTTTNNITVNKAGTVTNASTITNNGPITNVNTAGGAVQPLPTDYNREATQLAVKEDLDKLVAGTGARDSPDFAKDVEDKKTAMNKSITDITDAIPNDYAASKDNWFSWVWSPPVGECSPYEGNVHGNSVTWDICPYIAKTRDVIGWLFALYGAWIVYNQMFRKDES